MKKVGLIILTAFLGFVGCARNNQQDYANSPNQLCYQNPSHPSCSYMQQSPYYGQMPGSAYGTYGCQSYYGSGWAPANMYTQPYYNYGSNYNYGTPQGCINYGGIQSQFGYQGYTYPYGGGGSMYGNCIPGGVNTCPQGFCRPISAGMGICSMQ